MPKNGQKTRRHQTARKNVSDSKRNLENLSSADRKFLNDIGRRMIIQIALNAVGAKELDVANKTDEELQSEINQYFKKLLEAKRIKFGIRVDHTPDLLKEARARNLKNDFNMAAVLYATYFEHQVNLLLVQLCERKGIAEGVLKTIVRASNLEAKCTWILQLLGIQPLKKIWVARINSIAEVRNAFVHYKWQTEPDDPAIEPDAEKAEKLKYAEGIVRYLRRFEEQKVHAGHGHRIKRILTRHTIS
jgi:hypothetical protein